MKSKINKLERRKETQKNENCVVNCVLIGVSPSTSVCQRLPVRAWTGICPEHNFFMIKDFYRKIDFNNEEEEEKEDEIVVHNNESETNQLYPPEC